MKNVGLKKDNIKLTHMQKLKQQKGITLVALVITIIILLILAGISIQAVTNTGLFTNAKEAKERMTVESANEDMKLKLMEAQVEMSAQGKKNNDLVEIADYLKEKYKDSIDTTIIINYLASVTINTNGISNPSALKVEYNNYGFAIDRKGQLNESLTTSLSTDEGKEKFVSITTTAINSNKKEESQIPANSFQKKAKVGDYIKYVDYTDVTGKLDNSWIVVSQKLDYYEGEENYLYIASNGCPVKAIAWTANHYYDIKYTEYQTNFAKEVTPIYGWYGPMVQMSQYNRLSANNITSNETLIWSFESAIEADNAIKEYNADYEGVEKGAFLKVQLKDEVEIQSGTGTKADPYILK